MFGPHAARLSSCIHGQRLRRKLKSLKRRIKRSKWVPSHWQTPDRVATRQRHQNLSDIAVIRHDSSEPSSLITLPVELRLLIYRYIFSTPSISGECEDCDQKDAPVLQHLTHYPVNCLWRIPGRLIAKPPSVHSNVRFSVLIIPDRPRFHPVARLFASVLYRKSTYVLIKRDIPQIYTQNRLALLLTCRQIYAEAVATFYTAPTFLIQDMPVLFDLSTSLLPHRLAQIRHLHLHFLLRWAAISSWWASPKSDPDNAAMWARAWAIVGRRMTGLRELTVYIRQFTWDSRPSARTERKVLEPLAAELRGLTVFRLWYRHERVWDPFGYSYENAYTYDILGEECKDAEAVGFRERLGNLVRDRTGPG